MKNIVFALFVLLTMACSKKNDRSEANDIPRDIPVWLQTKIAELKVQKDAEVWIVNKYSIDGAVYYNIAASYQSCILCSLYTENGNSTTVELGAKTEVRLLRAIWPVVK